MNEEIDRINRLLPNLGHNKTVIIRRWITRVLERMEHYKSEHYALLKEDMTQLELSLWKASLHEEEEEEKEQEQEEQPAKKAKLDTAASRHEARVTCGANIIIPHVLSFLNDREVFPTARAIPL